MPRRFPSHRFYFAFRPDQTASEAAMEIVSKLSLEGSPVKRENLHVSLFPLWEGEKIQKDMIEIASTLVQAIDGKPFDFKFDTLASFAQGRRHCVVLTASHDPFEIYNLQRKFVSRFEGMVQAGNLKPHMTLFYADAPVEKRAVVPVRWQAREFLLIHSFLGQGRQEILGRWPLR